MRDANRNWAMAFGSLGAAILLVLWLVTGTALAQTSCTDCPSNCVRWVWMTGQCQSGGYAKMNVKDENCNNISGAQVFSECTEAICSLKCANSQGNDYNWDCTAPADDINGSSGCAYITSIHGTMCTNNCFGKFCAGSQSNNRCLDTQVNPNQGWSLDNVQCKCAS